MATLTFTRGKNFNGNTYTAQTDTHRFVVRQDRTRRACNGRWIVTIYVLETVGELSPITIAGAVVDTLTYHYTRASAYADAQLWADIHTA